MKKTINKLWRFLLPAILLLAFMPVLVSGFSIRVEDCHCDESGASCSIVQTDPAAQQSLPPCCTSDNDASQNEQGCQDDCCVREVQLISVEAKFLNPVVKVFEVRCDISTTRTVEPYGIQTLGLAQSDLIGPPGHQTGRHLLILFHQLRIASPDPAIA